MRVLALDVGEATIGVARSDFNKAAKSEESHSDPTA